MFRVEKAFWPGPAVEKLPCVGEVIFYPKSHCELNYIQSLVESIRDLLFSHGPSVSRQPHRPRKQAVAQQPADELNPELIIEFLRW